MHQTANADTIRTQPRYRTESRVVPPGWTTNPSDPARRIVLAGLATIGFLTAAYLALYQTGVISSVWEPFFGSGSKTILNSSLSRAFPVSDAALGGAAYFLDALLAIAGGADRWESHPWFVLANGAVSIGLGLVAIMLLVIQPLAFGSYCTLCVLSAFISLNLVGPTVEESLAALQYLGRTYTEPTEHQRKLDAEHAGEPAHPPAANCWNASGLRLRHLVGAIIGLWLLVSPAAIGFTGFARVDARIMGPIILAISILSVWPATRWFARLNGFAGLWLIFGPILLLSPQVVLMSNIALGAILLGLALFPGYTAWQIGNGWVGILGPGSDKP